MVDRSNDPRGQPYSAGEKGGGDDRDPSQCDGRDCEKVQRQRDPAVDAESQKAEPLDLWFKGNGRQGAQPGDHDERGKVSSDLRLQQNSDLIDELTVLPIRTKPCAGWKRHDREAKHERCYRYPLPPRLG